MLPAMEPRLVLPLAALAVALAGCSAAAPGAAPSSGSAAAASPVTEATIVAHNVAFGTTALTLASGASIHLVFQNNDAGIPHNLHIRGGGQDVVKTDIVVGPAKQDLTVGPLQPGAYGFTCDVHPNMRGTITVPTP
jgi:plastocyanin